MGATMTKSDVDKLIRDIIGEELAEVRQQLEEQGKKVTDSMKFMQESQKRSELRTFPKGLRAARWLRAMAACKGDYVAASKLAKDVYRDEEVSKALAESVFEGGGAIVPDEYVAEVIDLLRAQTVVRALGARPMPMNSGSLTMPYLAKGTTAYYVGENKNITVSEPEFGQLQLSAKKLAALVPISNDLLRDSSPATDTIVRDDMVRTIGLREDLAFIRDDGTENKPKGMRHWVATGNVANRGGSALANVVSDLGKCIRNLEEADVPMFVPGWIMTPRTKWFLMTLLDSNGNYVFRAEMLTGNLMTYPFRTTTQIPNNLASPQANTSEIYFADFASLIIGENTQLLVDVFPGGAYYDGTTVVSGISTDQTVMRVLERHDFGARYRGKEISVLTVDWGSA